MKPSVATAMIEHTGQEITRCCADLDHAEHCRLVESIRREPTRAGQCRAIAKIIKACRAAAQHSGSYDIAHELHLAADALYDIAESADLAEDEAAREEHFAKQRELRRRRGEIV